MEETEATKYESNDAGQEPYEPRETPPTYTEPNSVREFLDLLLKKTAEMERRLGRILQCRVSSITFDDQAE